MAKLPDEFCVVTFEIRSALEEGRKADAKRIAVEQLRAGYHSPEFLNIVAEMWADKKRGKNDGRPKNSFKQHWVHIGTDFLDLYGDGAKDDDGDKYDNVCKKLVKKWGYSYGTITAAVAFFRKALEDSK
jgi:hypothetical protein